jgi:hypothetical protein
MLPPPRHTASASTTDDFGAPSRGSMHLLSTLRGHGCPCTALRPRKTRCRLVGHPCRSGLSPAGCSVRFPSPATCLPPHPGLAWRTCRLSEIAPGIPRPAPYPPAPFPPSGGKGEERASGARRVFWLPFPPSSGERGWGIGGRWGSPARFLACGTTGARPRPSRTVVSRLTSVVSRLRLVPEHHDAPNSPTPRRSEAEPR